MFFCRKCFAKKNRFVIIILKGVKMKFFHVADIHLGAKNRALTPQKQELLKSERLEALRDFFVRAKDENVDFVVIAGDLFHSKSPQAKLVKNFFDMVAQSGLCVVYIKGNHDEKWEGQVPQNFIILDENKPCISIGDVDIWSAIDDKIIRSNIDKSRKNILVLHGNIENPSDNDYVDVKNYIDIPFDYVAMGHIHSFAPISLYGKSFVYSGSLFSNGFDECGEKGYVEVLIDKKTSFQFCPLNGRCFKICKVDKGNAKTTREIIQKIEEAFERDNVRKCDIVRVELYGYFEEDEDKNLTMINSAFFEQFYFEIIDKTKLKIDLEKLKAESLSFKAEFIKLVEESELSEEDKTAICLVGIEALKGEDLSL